MTREPKTAAVRNRVETNGFANGMTSANAITKPMKSSPETAPRPTFSG